jgi:hypothetical protein
LIRYLWASPNTVVGMLLAALVLAGRGRARLVDGVLELEGPFARVVLARCVPIRGGAGAMTFGHVVLGRDDMCLEATRSHERVHVRQCEVWGPAFLPAYLVASLWAWLTGRGAYRGNFFEREAVRLAAACDGADVALDPAHPLKPR